MALVGACLPAYAPATRLGTHHAAVTRQSPDSMCLGCHEPEALAAERLADVPAPEREAEMERMMSGGGALVAQWMIEDRRSCLTCHVPRRPIR